MMTGYLFLAVLPFQADNTIAATMLDLMGLKPPGEMEGRSLLA